MFPHIILAFLIGYLIGSVPSGILVGYYYGVDPRRIGSGRTGSTNVYRAAGLFAALLTAFLDLLKGMLAFIAANALLADMPLVLAMAGIGAVAGHNWSLFLGFHGGAGTMTSSGVLLLIDWVTFCGLGLLTLMILRVSRMASVGSIFFAVALPMALVIGVVQGNLPWEYVLYGFGEMVMVLWALRPNMKRILAGEERIIGEPARKRM